MDYTVDTLATLRRVFPSDVEFFFITGADAVLEILAWKEPERVLEWCDIIAATRQGYDLARLRDGRGVRYLVPDGVGALIHKSRTYGPSMDAPSAGAADRD